MNGIDIGFLLVYYDNFQIATKTQAAAEEVRAQIIANCEKYDAKFKPIAEEGEEVAKATLTMPKSAAEFAVTQQDWWQIDFFF